MGSCINTAEFLEAGGTAQPGLTKAAPAHEKEGAWARADTTAQQGTNGSLILALGAPHPEQRQCLTEDVGGHHDDDRLLQLCVMGDLMDGPVDHYEKTHWSVVGMQGGGVRPQAPHLPPPPTPPTHTIGGLTKVTGTCSQEKLRIATGPAGT